MTGGMTEELQGQPFDAAILHGTFAVPRVGEDPSVVELRIRRHRSAQVEYANAQLFWHRREPRRRSQYGARV
jgi:hypothetical protein